MGLATEEARLSTEESILTAEAVDFLSRIAAPLRLMSPAALNGARSPPVGI